MEKIYRISRENVKSTAMVFHVNGKNESVVFRDRNNNNRLLFTTRNPSLQQAIEEHHRFESGEIVLIQGKPGEYGKKKSTKSTPDEPIDPDPIEPALEEPEETSESVVYGEITKWQDAKEILKNEPYNVAHQAIRTPEQILSKAAEVGVSFPNLKN